MFIFTFVVGKSELFGSDCGRRSSKTYLGMRVTSSSTQLLLERINMLQAQQKNDTEQALGRSRRGLITKIHAACIDEVSIVGLVLSPGHSTDYT
jgi:hypothetical protein